MKLDDEAQQGRNTLSAGIAAAIGVLACLLAFVRAVLA